MEIEGQMNTIVETDNGRWVIVADCGTLWLESEATIDAAVAWILEAYEYYAARS